MIIAFDTETFYDKELSVRTMGVRKYVEHPKFECYMISLYAPGYISWCGHPKDCPWDQLLGHTLIAHNAGFDRAVLMRLINDGVAPAAVMPKTFWCTADMSAYCGYPRALADVVKILFGHKMDKNIRDNEIKGLYWNDMPAELQKRVLDYALDDSVWAYKVWEELSPLWPEHEREFSMLNRQMCYRGLPIDVAGIKSDIRVLESACAENFKRIPWTAEGLPVLSKKALNKYCASVGIEAPVSLAQDSDECSNWEEKYGEQYPVVRYMRDYRRCNALLKKYNVMMERNCDGWLPYELIYMGGHTGRMSGGGGWNPQNLPREALLLTADFCITTEKGKAAYSLYMRGRIKAPEGHLIGATDYAQIEARVLPWMARDHRTLDLVRQGFSVYEIPARRSGAWTSSTPLKKGDPALYQVYKSRVLGLGFGMGFVKYVTFAKTMMTDEVFSKVFHKAVSTEAILGFYRYVVKYDKSGDVRRLWSRSMKEHDIPNDALSDLVFHLWKTESAIKRAVWPADPALLAIHVSRLTPEQREMVNAWIEVMDFREQNPEITDMWKRLRDGLESSIGDSFVVNMPSGRRMTYLDVDKDKRGMNVRTIRGERKWYLHGGLICENCVQATARDVMVYAFLNLWHAGFMLLLTVHDEILTLHKADGTEKDQLAEVGRIMTLPPPWAKTLPLGVEGDLLVTYKK